MRQPRISYEFNIKEIEAFIEDNLEDIYDKNKQIEDEKKRIEKHGGEVVTKHTDIIYKNQKVNWDIELMYIPFAPKEPLNAFASSGGSIFMSKKKPLLIVCLLADEYETEISLKANYAYKTNPTG